MQLGMVGLGKMGARMRERLAGDGHQVPGFDPRQSNSAPTLEEMVAALAPPRNVWMMVPAGDVTRDTVKQLAKLLDPGDLVVDGGNSKYTDDLIHHDFLNANGLGFVDCGVSGGVWGLEYGYALMAGGDEAHVRRLSPVFESLKPPGPDGFVHAGLAAGAGHFAKMVHNGIEYGIMQAYAEGFEVLARSPLIKDVAAVFRSWREGTVIRSWLLDLLVSVLDDDAALSKIRGVAQDSGEARWFIEAAVELGIPTPAIADALFARLTSQQDNSPAMRAVAAMRNRFGGHALTTA